MSAPYPVRPNTIKVFDTPDHFGVIKKGTTMYVPFQTSPKEVEPKAAALLRSIRPLGWDAMPEKLTECVFYSVAGWAISKHHSEKEVTALIESHGFKVLRVTVSETEFRINEPAKPWAGLVSPSDAMRTPIKVMPLGMPPPVGDLYARTRYLWKKHKTEFVPFELAFVESIGKQLKAGRPLSDKQDTVLLRILKKYAVPYDATAAAKSKAKTDLNSVNAIFKLKMECARMVAKTANESLTLLGVDGHLNPTVSRFPKSYNPKALKLWIRALEQIGNEYEETIENWMATIRAFLKLCRENEVDAFDQAKAEVVNKGIEDWLRSNRVKAIKFCNDTEIFKHFTIATAKRTAAITGQHGRNFYVENVARLKAIEDPTLEKWLLNNPMPGFTDNGDRSYTRTVNAAASITINFIGSSSATVTLNIYCHSLPVIEGKKTNKALAKYIETQMWSPLVRRFKFNGVTKLF